MADLERAPTPRWEHQDMRLKAGGTEIQKMLWPRTHGIAPGARFALITERGEVIALGAAAEHDHVMIEFGPHELDPGRYYRVRPILDGPDPHVGDVLPRDPPARTADTQADEGGTP